MKNLNPILYVEDNESDALFMKDAFKQLGIANPLRVVTDGAKAIEYLGSLKPDDTDSQPCLVLLDLGMPGQNGLDVLNWIRNEPAQVALPVIVLTSSSQESDIHRAFLLRANGFITKPAEPAKFLNIVKAIEQYWLSGNPHAESFADFATASQVSVRTDDADQKGSGLKR
jgi:CheY-like chemotaxis protein